MKFLDVKFNFGNLFSISLSKNDILWVEIFTWSIILVDSSELEIEKLEI